MLVYEKLIRLLGLLPLLSLFLSGCSVSKFIPEGSYLLDEVKIESDNKEVKSSEMSLYVRQTPNAKWFSLVKLPLYIYSASGLDSTRWINRVLRKIGDAPRIFDPVLAEETRSQMQQAVQNKGYMGARVELKEEKKGNRLKAIYQITTGDAYTVDRLTYDIPDFQIHDYLMADSAHSLLSEGMMLDVNVLDAERQRMTNILQNRGYYRFNKDFIAYQADTLLGSRKVDLKLSVLPYRRKQEDSPSAHRQYMVRSVNYLLDPSPGALPAGDLSGMDSIQAEGIKIFITEKSRSCVRGLFPHPIVCVRDICTGLVMYQILIRLSAVSVY